MKTMAIFLTTAFLLGTLFGTGMTICIIQHDKRITVVSGTADTGRYITYKDTVYQLVLPKDARK